MTAIRRCPTPKKLTRWKSRSRGHIWRSRRAWFIAFLGHGRSQMTITSKMINARLAIERPQNQHNESSTPKTLS